MVALRLYMAGPIASIRPRGALNAIPLVAPCARLNRKALAPDGERRSGVAALYGPQGGASSILPGVLTSYNLKGCAARKSRCT
jgi:hypothetical protein